MSTPSTDAERAPPKTIAFFNNKGGVGTTTLVYHLAWMMKELGYRVLAADLDPQSNLTAAFLANRQMTELWLDEEQAPATIFGAIEPLCQHLGDIRQPQVYPVEQDEGQDVALGLLAGDLNLSAFEDRLAQAWPACFEQPPNRDDAFRVTTAFYQAIVMGAAEIAADVVLIDVGPNLGALNRAALVAADFVVIPMGADPFTLRGLRSLGPKLREWREGWRQRLELGRPHELIMPGGEMKPVGYILQPAAREYGPTQPFQGWIDQAYRRHVLGLSNDGGVEPEHLLGAPKNYLSLIPLAQQAHKPVFALRAADGALGSQAVAAKASYGEFEALARKIAAACGLPAPS